MNKEQLLELIKINIREKNKVILNILRDLKTKIILFEKESHIDCNQQQINDFLSKMGKDRSKSIELYLKGNREDLVNKEQIELDIINLYLPKKLDKQQLNDIIIDFYNQGIISKGDLFKNINSKYPNQDKKMINDIINNIIK